MDNGFFFSIDRLVEFGLSMSVANQMVQQMNEAMKNMYIPGSQMNFGIAQDTIYVVIDGKSAGPFTSAQFKDLVVNKVVNKDTLVWLPGMPAWKPAEEVPTVLRLIALTPPPVPVS